MSPSVAALTGCSTRSRSSSPYNKAVAAEKFQVWKLTVRADHSATLTCDDGNRRIVFTKEIPYTDFPLAEITVWFANNVIYLPSEH